MQRTCTTCERSSRKFAAAVFLPLPLVVTDQGTSDADIMLPFELVLQSSAASSCQAVAHDGRLIISFRSALPSVDYPLAVNCILADNLTIY